MNIIQKIAEDLSLKKMQVEAAVQLLDEGNTVLKLKNLVA